MNIFLRTLLSVERCTREIRLILSNVLFRYRANVASKRLAYLDRLILCVGREFRGTPSFTSVGRHTQPAPGYAHSKTGERESEICWEAPVGITVYFDEKPVLGMAVEFRGPHLCIKQLQGVAGTQLPNELRDWPARFVKGAMNFLYNTEELVSVRLYTANQRLSYRFPFDKDLKRIVMSKEEKRLYQQRLRRRYDGTARQMGFTRRNNRYYDWYAPTDETQTAD